MQKHLFADAVENIKDGVGTPEECEGAIAFVQRTGRFRPSREYLDPLRKRTGLPPDLDYPTALKLFTAWVKERCKDTPSYQQADIDRDSELAIKGDPEAMKRMRIRYARLSHVIQTRDKRILHAVMAYYFLAKDVICLLTMGRFYLTPELFSVKTLSEMGPYLKILYPYRGLIVEEFRGRTLGSEQITKDNWEELLKKYHRFYREYSLQVPKDSVYGGFIRANVALLKTLPSGSARIRPYRNLIAVTKSFFLYDKLLEQNPGAAEAWEKLSKLDVYSPSMGYIYYFLIMNADDLGHVYDFSAARGSDQP